ncbi:hypothetical protein D3C79_1077850 [compost metagenome]
MLHVVDAVATHVAIGLAGANTDASGEAIPTVMGALQPLVDALVHLTELLVEVALDVAPVGDVG